MPLFITYTFLCSLNTYLVNGVFMCWRRVCSLCKRDLKNFNHPIVQGVSTWSALTGKWQYTKEGGLIPHEMTIYRVQQCVFHLDWIQWHVFHSFHLPGLYYSSTPGPSRLTRGHNGHPITGHQSLFEKSVVEEKSNPFLPAKMWQKHWFTTSTLNERWSTHSSLSGLSDKDIYIMQDS